MAEENSQASTETEAKATPKRKTAAKRKVTAKRKTGTTAQRKSTARGKRTGRGRAAARQASTLQDRVSEAGRKAFLASLGFYGMAYDQMQDQLKSVEGELQSRRKKADKLYADMIKRGEKVEKKAKATLEDVELPRLELGELTDRSKLEARLEKARERFSELRGSMSFKAAA